MLIRPLSCREDRSQSYPAYPALHSSSDASARWTSFAPVSQGVFFQLMACRRASRSEVRILTASTNWHCSTAITSSMGLKFTPQRKHRARFVLGFVAVWNSLQRGQRKRKYPSRSFHGMSRRWRMRSLIGRSFLSDLRRSPENRWLTGNRLRMESFPRKIRGSAIALVAGCSRRTR